MTKFPTSKSIIEEALKENPRATVVELHELTFMIMKKHRDDYYRERIEDFFKRPTLKSLPEKLKLEIKKEIMKPVQINEKIYTNFMEEVSRRMSQTFQPIAGNLAELCIEKFLNDLRLERKTHYDRKVDHTDILLYHPNSKNVRKKHRVEVKNVALRERATRGLTFDGDSMVGFFNDPAEFTKNNVDIIEKECLKKGGHCYVPKEILKIIKSKYKVTRFKSIEDFALEAKRFVEKGVI